MCTTPYYVQDFGDTPWLLRFYYDGCVPPAEHKNVYQEIPIVNYMGSQWSSSYDLLTYLLKNRSMRRQLLKIRNKAVNRHPHASILRRPLKFHFQHPLLQTPLSLSSIDTESEFAREIYCRRELERTQG